MKKKTKEQSMKKTKRPAIMCVEKFQQKKHLKRSILNDHKKVHCKKNNIPSWNFQRTIFAVV